VGPSGTPRQPARVVLVVVLVLTVDVLLVVVTAAEGSR
jgi:hypothetical protein